MARTKTLSILPCPSSQLGCPSLLTELVLVAQALLLLLNEKTIGIMRSPYSSIHFSLWRNKRPDLCFVSYITPSWKDRDFDTTELGHLKFPWFWMLWVSQSFLGVEEGCLLPRKFNGPYSNRRWITLAGQNFWLCLTTINTRWFQYISASPQGGVLKLSRQYALEVL